VQQSLLLETEDIMSDDGGIFEGQNHINSSRRESQGSPETQEPEESRSGGGEAAVLIGGAILAGIATIAGLFLGRKKP
jgi:hypothetical protein